MGFLNSPLPPIDFLFPPPRFEPRLFFFLAPSFLRPGESRPSHECRRCSSVMSLKIHPYFLKLCNNVYLNLSVILSMESKIHGKSVDIAEDISEPECAVTKLIDEFALFGLFNELYDGEDLGLICDIATVS
jgi:hypothetical protein